jgi:hypothetical protein
MYHYMCCVDILGTHIFSTWYSLEKGAIATLGATISVWRRGIPLNNANILFKILLVEGTYSEPNECHPHTIEVQHLRRLCQVSAKFGVL